MSNIEELKEAYHLAIQEHDEYRNKYGEESDFLLGYMLGFKNAIHIMEKE